MRRRDFIAAIGSAAATWPLPTHAQQPAKVHCVAFIVALSPVSELVGANPINPAVRGFVHGLRDLGYVEGKNLVMEWRTAEGKYERFPDIIRELLSLNVDVIVSVNDMSTRAAKDMTRTVPIVMGATDPVKLGFIESLARPGGNLTGISFDTGIELVQKHAEFIKQLLPTMSHLAFLWPEKQWDPRNAQAMRLSIGQAARVLGLKLLFAEPTPTNYADAHIARERPDALLVAAGNAQFVNRRLIVEFAAANRLPTMHPFVEAVREGGLMGQGPDFPFVFRRLAQYVDKILKGAKPADLAVEQPTRFRLVINLKTAKALGLTVLPTLLARADEVIE